MGLSGWVEAKQSLGNYETYAKWREVWTLDDASRRPAPASPSVSALWREGDKNVRLYGARCRACGYVQYPAQRVCVECRKVDDGEPVRLSDKAGELFTYSMDYIAGAVDTPLVVAVVDFEGGGRVLCMMTDREVGRSSGRYARRNELPQAARSQRNPQLLLESHTEANGSRVTGIR